MAVTVRVGDRDVGRFQVRALHEPDDGTLGQRVHVGRRAVEVRLEREADAVPGAEDIDAHLDEIMDLGEFIVPESANDALRKVATRIAERDGTTI